MGMGWGGDSFDRLVGAFRWSAWKHDMDKLLALCLASSFHFIATKWTVEFGLVQLTGA